ncbi:MAG: O-antigen ligase family protein [Casimicrobiaceae bacterium]
MVKNSSVHRRAPAPPGEPALPLPGALLAVTLFMLSADLLFIGVAGQKIKVGYFLVLGAWLTAPVPMFTILRDALRRVPLYAWLPLFPLAVSVLTSASLRDSVAWSLWLAFDLFTIATIYVFLKAHAFSSGQVRTAATWGLAGIVFFAVLQFVAIYLFRDIIFQPQAHFDVYRINGLAGWPHFLNIFSFLLLPVVLVQRRLPWATRVVLVLLTFVLVQSTAKTGWVLFVVLGCLLLLLDRRVFVRGYLLFLLPCVIVALLVPTPSLTPAAPALSGAEKITRFSADLDITDKTTSGTDRVVINKMGLRVWWRHPWFGVGPRAYDDYVFTRFERELPGVSKLDGSGGINAKNENIWIEFLSECGALFTLTFLFVLCRALWVTRFAFANRLHLGTWIALVLYFGVSGQFSQTGLLTLAYGVLGIYFYAREFRTDPAPGDTQFGVTRMLPTQHPAGVSSTAAWEAS